MSELIDRQDVIDRLIKAEDVFRQNGAKLEANGIHYALELVESDIEIPTIGPRKERPQSEWKRNKFGEHYCNKCGSFALWSEEADDYYEVQSNFCPNCGVKMNEEVNNEQIRYST